MPRGVYVIGNEDTHPKQKLISRKLFFVHSFYQNKIKFKNTPRKKVLKIKLSGRFIT
jgi:hypothetical protein